MMIWYKMTTRWELGHEVGNSAKWKIQNCLCHGDIAWRVCQWQHSWLRDTADDSFTTDHFHWDPPCLSAHGVRALSHFTLVHSFTSSAHALRLKTFDSFHATSIHGHQSVCPRLDSLSFFFLQVCGKPAHSAKPGYGLYWRVLPLHKNTFTPSTDLFEKEPTISGKALTT